PNANPMMPPHQVSPAQYGPNANPMMPPHQVSPAQYGPNANPMMPPHQVSPAQYGPNANPMMPPHQVSPAQYGPNANPMMPPHQVSPAQYGPNANPMMPPHQVSPAHYGPKTNPMMGSPCGCDKGPQGFMPMHQGPMWGEPHMPPMQGMGENPWQGYGMEPNMQGEFQPQYWEPNNDGDLYGMMPADEYGQQGSTNNESNEDR
ncbi:MAG TPA: hypothetical protein VF199_04555, partial [Bacillales bacterium]